MRVERKINLTDTIDSGCWCAGRSVVVHPVPHAARGFSLIELLVVLSVTVVLAGILMPSMSQIRENASRVICSSNLRNIGQATIMYEGEYGRLPLSNSMFRESPDPRELMATHQGGTAQDWDGLGWLYEGRFLPADIFYCPSHTGNHPYESYSGQWAHNRYAGWGETVDSVIYINYHYAGHKNWLTGERRFLTAQTVLATDGLRSVEDFNHQTGMNILRGDGSVRFRDNGGMVLPYLVDSNSGDNTATSSMTGFAALWERIERDR